MRCEQCEAETDGGDTYVFYYGTHLTQDLTEIALDAMHEVKTELYRIAGSESVYICHRCILRNKVNEALGFGIGLVVASILMLGLWFGAHKPTDPNPTILFVLSLFAGLWQLYSGLSLRRLIKKGEPTLLHKAIQQRRLINDGDQLAIQIRKPKLMQNGYDSYFTRQEYSRLEVRRN